MLCIFRNRTARDLLENSLHIGGLISVREVRIWREFQIFVVVHTFTITQVLVVLLEFLVIHLEPKSVKCWCWTC